MAEPSGVTHDPLLRRLADKIPSLMAGAGVRSLALALIEDGDLVWQPAFGHGDPVSGAPLTDATVFDADILVEPTFAYLVLTLCAQGLLDLDLPLVFLFPDPFVASGLDLGEQHLQDLTVRRILAHSAVSGDSHGYAADVLAGSRPGARAIDGRHGLGLLQAIVEMATGKSLATLLSQRVLQPLDMRGSYVRLTERDEARGMSGARDGAPDGGTVQPAVRAHWSLSSTLRDATAFCLDLLIPGERDTKRLAQAMREQMFRPQTRIDDALSWGLGWGLVLTAAGECFWQWGDSGDTQSFVVGSRTHQHGLVMVTDAGRGLSVCARIVTALFGPEYAYPIEWALGHGT